MAFFVISSPPSVTLNVTFLKFSFVLLNISAFRPMAYSPASVLVTLAVPSKSKSDSVYRALEMATS